jgi:N-acetyl-gamma-glutamyl-phosphate reductase
MGTKRKDRQPGSGTISAGVVGATGYTGLEVVRVLAGHGGVEVAFASSRTNAGKPSPVAGLDYLSPEEVPASDVDVVFLCLPHGASVSWVKALRGVSKVIDLTADHRPGSGREEGVVYGLAERNHKTIAGAEVVANPGCYPTGVLCSLAPLFDAGLIDAGRLTVVNAASGVTGAGRTPRTDLLFAEVSGDYRAYGEGNRHRHLKEMRALLPDASLLFQPHLLPVSRGILETITVPVREDVDAELVRDTWRGAYQGSSAIEVLAEGLPGLSRVVGSDRLSLGACDVEDVSPAVVTVVAALDNLGKGAAGQAVQNMNLLFGWDIDRGIRC